MIRKTTLHLLLLLAAFGLTSCSGLPKGTGGGGGGGNGTVSFTLVADTLPASPSLLSFRVSILSVTLTPATGTAITLTPATPIVVDLMRLQSDTAFLGSLASVPAGTYTVSVSLSGSSITLLNDTGSPLLIGNGGCPVNLVCSDSISALGSPSVASFTLTVSSATNQGVELDFNLNNAITISNGTLTVNFAPTSPAPGVLSAFTLPRNNANLASGQLELIEDFTGVVNVSGTNVTITSPTRGTLSATITTGTGGTFFDQSPAPGTLCANAPSTTSCAANGQIASVDAFLNSNGTLTLKEFEPLTATQQDFVEGIVVLVAPPNQFTILVTDEIQAASGSLISSLTPGQFLTVNIPAPKQFFVDTKGLAVGSLQGTDFTFFQGATDTTPLFTGQDVAVNITAFTAAAGAGAVASATATDVTLRWSRFIAGIENTSSSLVNVNNLPTYFGASSAQAFFGAQVFNGTLGADGITNLDGVTDAGSLNAALPVALRALFLESSTGSAPVPFIAAKIRQQ